MEEQIFDALYEMRPARVLAIIFGLIGSCLVVAVSGFVIWFDLNSTSQGKSLINSLTRYELPLFE